EKLFLAGEAVLHAPQLGTVWMDENMQSAAIGKLVRLAALCRVFDLEFRERHGPCPSGGIGPNATPKNTPNSNGSGCIERAAAGRMTARRDGQKYLIWLGK